MATLEKVACVQSAGVECGWRDAEDIRMMEREWGAECVGGYYKASPPPATQSELVILYE